MILFLCLDASANIGFDFGLVANVAFFFSAFASCVQQFVTYSAATVGCKPAHENFHWLNQGALQASARFYL